MRNSGKESCSILEHNIATCLVQVMFCKYFMVSVFDLQMYHVRMMLCLVQPL